MTDIKKLKAHQKFETSHNVDDPIEREIIRIQNIGFEEAHKLRSCGHSVGDYRDAKYGTPEYDGDESCVGCDSQRQLLEAIFDEVIGKPKKHKIRTGINSHLSGISMEESGYNQKRNEILAIKKRILEGL